MKPLIFPVAGARAEHDRRTRAGDVLVVIVAMAGLGFWAGYDIGVKIVADVRVAKCGPSTEYADVIEHAFSHRGEVFYRECLTVPRPFVVPAPAPSEKTQSM